ncbi:MAG: threonine/serine exporter family protein [Lachnospiraceae bacterium]|nr:threonine/serine exporter family protein [Lachnospiraceae bacterium]
MEQKAQVETSQIFKTKVFETAILAGEILLESGAEIVRVEDTMRRIARAFQLENFDIYVLTSGLFASADIDDRRLNSRIKEIQAASPHFGKIDEVNEISRQLVSGHYTVEDAYERMKLVKRMPSYPVFVHAFGAGLGAICFCYLLDGSPRDSLFSFLAGFLMWILVVYFRKWGMKRTLCNVLGSAIACSLCIVFHSIGFGDSVDKMIIGTLIPLIPGVSFVNGIRDLSDNNFLSGMVRLLDVAVATTCMAIGSGVVIEFANRLGGLL